jgi:hypothetical protein
MVPVMTVPVAAANARALRNPKHALHAADGAANCTTNHAANRATHGTGRPVAGGCTFLRSTDDALGLNGSRESHERRDGGSDKNTFVHAVNSCVLSRSQPVRGP